MKIENNTLEQIFIIINEIQSDLEFSFNKIITDYLSSLFLRSIKNELYIPDPETSDKVNPYEVAEFNLLKATINSVNKDEKKLFSTAAYKVYLSIFENTEDELSFEICSNFDNIEIVLDSIKFYSIRFNINELLNLKDKKIPYINRRLSKLKYLELKYEDILF